MSPRLAEGCGELCVPKPRLHHATRRYPLIRPPHASLFRDAVLVEVECVLGRRSLSPAAMKCRSLRGHFGGQNAASAC